MVKQKKPSKKEMEQTLKRLEESKPTPIENKSILKQYVSGYYDLQKLKIAMGNRIMANFRARLGYTSNMSSEDLDKIKAVSAELLGTAVGEWKRATDAFIESRPQLRKYLREHNRILTEEVDFVLVSKYMGLDDDANDLKKTIEPFLKNFDIYNEFLKDVTGCGPMMSAVVIAVVDIYKAETVGKINALCGIDVIEVPCPICFPKDEHTKKIPKLPDSNCEDCNGSGYVNQGRRRTKWHLVPRTYFDSDGKEKKTQGLSFNPFFKTKMMGVLANQFSMQFRAGRNCIYGSTYVDYYNRMKQRRNLYKMKKINEGKSEKESEKLSRKKYPHGRIDLMSRRAALKHFFLDLYLKWREIEGLPITPPYHERVLGMKHHEKGGDGSVAQLKDYVDEDTREIIDEDLKEMTG